MSGTFPARAAQKALALFKNDLNCAESVFKALLLENGKTCPLELLRTASAFGRGMGEAGCCCGALVGERWPSASFSVGLKMLVHVRTCALQQRNSSMTASSVSITDPVAVCCTVAWLTTPQNSSKPVHRGLQKPPE